MKILYINCVQYDYLTASLIEGLQELGHDLRCSRDSNYGKAIPREELKDFAEAADLVILGSNAGVEHHLALGLDNPRIVAVDGSDTANFELSYQLRYKAVFKRELCAADQDGEGQCIYPMPFAAEKRYFGPLQQKQILVSFVANMHTNPLRNSVHTRLLNRKHPAIISGWTNERSYNVGAPQPEAIATPAYRDIIGRSLISVNAPGAGYDCARYWEILAAQTMLFTFAPDIKIPDPLIDGVHCMTFSSMTEFDMKLDYLVAHPDKAVEITNAGHAHLLSHHTTAKRAQYFLDKATAAVQRDGYIERFFNGQ